MYWCCKPQNHGLSQTGGDPQWSFEVQLLIPHRNKFYVWEHFPNAYWISAAWCCAHSPGQPVPRPPLSGEEPFPSIQPDPPLTQLHAILSGSVIFTESRAQRCPSTPCEELQAPWGLSSAPLLWAEQTQGPQPLFMLLALWTLHHLCSPRLDTL